MHDVIDHIRAERDERGASLVEYALLAALIALVCFAAIGYFGSSVGTKVSSSGSSISSLPG